MQENREKITKKTIEGDIVCFSSFIIILKNELKKIINKK